MVSEVQIVTHVAMLDDEGEFCDRDNEIDVACKEIDICRFEIDVSPQ